MRDNYLFSKIVSPSYVLSRTLKFGGEVNIAGILLYLKLDAFDLFNPPTSLLFLGLRVDLIGLFLIVYFCF